MGGSAWTTRATSVAVDERVTGAAAVGIVGALTLVAPVVGAVTALLVLVLLRATGRATLEGETWAQAGATFAGRLDDVEGDLSGDVGAAYRAGNVSLRLAGELESALGTAPGSVVVTSHDRWLRRRWEGPHLAVGG